MSKTGYILFQERVKNIPEYSSRNLDELQITEGKSHGEKLENGSSTWPAILLPQHGDKKKGLAQFNDIFKLPAESHD